MVELAEQQRFEEAGLARDRVRALADALSRMRVDRWLTARRLVLEGADGERLELAGGTLMPASPTGSLGAAGPIGAPAPRERADELSVVRSWVRSHPVRVLDCDIAPSERVDGGADLDRLLHQIRATDDPRSPRAGGLRRRERSARSQPPLPRSQPKCVQPKSLRPRLRPAPQPPPDRSRAPRRSPARACSRGGSWGFWAGSQLHHARVSSLGSACPA